MTTNNRNTLGKILKQRRVRIPLTLQELGHASSVSPSHLGRIERSDRFPSARVLRKIAKPLGFEEGELFALAGYLSSQPSTEVEKPGIGQLDPYVAMVLSQEPVEVQRAVMSILIILKSMAREMTKGSDCNIGFAEYVHKRYPELDEDTITMMEDILEHPPKRREG